MNLEGLGKAISEAIALRQLIETLNGKIADIEGKIGDNVNEIRKRNSLESVNVTLNKDKSVLEKELERNEAELKSRMVVLNKAGVSLPLGRDLPKGVISL